MKSKVVKLDDMTYATLKTLVEHCYNEQFDWAAGMRVKEEEDLSVTADKLDALLDDLVAADRWLMPDLHFDAHRHPVLRSTRTCQASGKGGRRGECRGVEEVLQGV